MSILKHGYHTFDNTGWLAPCLTHHDVNPSNGTTIAAVTGKHIVVLGISCEGFAELKEDPTGSTTTGTIRATIPGTADGLRFPGAVDMGYEMGVYLKAPSGDEVTIWYYIKDERIV